MKRRRRVKMRKGRRGRRKGRGKGKQQGDWAVLGIWIYRTRANPLRSNGISSS